ncbi:MAG: hypothetical protein RIT28_1589 [Pseudomonadota bacterium]
MSHIPSTDAEWITVAWLLRRALWTGRPLGPLEDEDRLFEHAERVMDIADQGPALSKFMLHKLFELRDTEDEAKFALNCLWDELRQHSGAEAVEGMRAAWAAQVQAWSPHSETPDLADEMFKIIEPLLPPVPPTSKWLQTLEVRGTFSDALSAHRERARITAKVKSVEDQLRRHVRQLSALYPSAVSAVLATQDDALQHALLIDFATDDGQSRHAAMGGQFPDLQDELHAILQPRVQVSHADTPHG